MTPPKRQKQEQEKEIQQQAYEATLTQQGNITWKDTVPDVASLPLTGNTVDDHRIVEADGFVRKRNGTGRVIPQASTPPPPAGSGVSAVHELVINTVDDEIVGKQYQSFANANAYASANPTENFITRFSGEITEDVQCVINNTIVGMDNIKSYINGTVSNAMFGGGFFSSFIYNVRIKEFQGSPFGLTILNKCTVEKVSNLEGSIGFIELDSTIQSDSSDFRVTTPMQTGVILYGGLMSAVQSVSYLQFNDRVQVTDVKSLGGSIVLDFSECTDLNLYNLLGRFTDIMYPESHPYRVEILGSLIDSVQELTVSSIVGDNGSGKVTVTTLYKHQLKDNDYITSSGWDDNSFDQYNTAVTRIDDYSFTYICPGVSNGPTANGRIQWNQRTTEFTNSNDYFVAKNSNIPGKFLINDGRMTTQTLSSDNAIQASAPGIREDLGDLIDISGMPLITKKDTHGVIKEIYALIGTNTHFQPVIYWDASLLGTTWDAVENYYHISTFTTPVKMIVVPDMTLDFYFSTSTTYSGLDMVDIEFPDGCNLIITNDCQATLPFRSIKGDINIRVENLSSPFILPQIGTTDPIVTHFEGNVKISSISQPFIDCAYFQNLAPFKMTGDWSALFGGDVIRFNPYLLDNQNIVEVRRGTINLNTLGGGNNGSVFLMNQGTTSKFNNEKHTITFASTPVAGTYALNWNGNTFAEIPYNSDAPTLQINLSTIPALSQVIVTGDYINGFLIEMVGINSTQRGLGIGFTETGLVDTHSQSVIVNDTLTPGNFAVTTLSVVPATVTGGTFQLSVDLGMTRSNQLARDISANDLATALIALSGITGISCSGDINTGFSILRGELYANPNRLVMLGGSLSGPASVLTILPITANAIISTQHNNYSGYVTIGNGVSSQNIRRRTRDIIASGGILPEDDLINITVEGINVLLNTNVIPIKAHQIEVTFGDPSTPRTGGSTLSSTNGFYGCGIQLTNTLTGYAGERCRLEYDGVRWKILSYDFIMREGTTSPLLNITPRKKGEKYYDTVGTTLYTAVGLTNADWIS